MGVMHPHQQTRRSLKENGFVLNHHIRFHPTFTITNSRRIPKRPKRRKGHGMVFCDQISLIRLVLTVGLSPNIFRNQYFYQSIPIFLSFHVWHFQTLGNFLLNKKERNRDRSVLPLVPFSCPVFHFFASIILSIYRSFFYFIFYELQLL